MPRSVLAAACGLATTLPCAAVIQPTPGQDQTTTISASVGAAGDSDSASGPGFEFLIPGMASFGDTVGGITGSAEAEGDITVSPFSINASVSATASAAAFGPFVVGTAGYAVRMSFDNPTPFDLFGSGVAAGGQFSQFQVILTRTDPFPELIAMVDISDDAQNFAFSGILAPGDYFLNFNALASVVTPADLAATSSGSVTFLVQIPGPATAGLGLAGGLFAAIGRHRRR